MLAVIIFYLSKQKNWPSKGKFGLYKQKCTRVNKNVYKKELYGYGNLNLIFFKIQCTLCICIKSIIGLNLCACKYDLEFRTLYDSLDVHQRLTFNWLVCLFNRLSLVVIITNVMSTPKCSNTKVDTPLPPSLSQPPSCWQHALPTSNQTFCL